MKIYCVKCKRKTGTRNGKKIYVNGHRALTGTCIKCGTKKFQFIK